MEFLKLHFFTPDRCKFSYALTVTTVHETKVLSSGGVHDERSNEDESYKYSHLYYAVNRDSTKSKSQLCYVGQDVTSIPEILGKMYGSKVKSLDLSFNSLTTLNHSELFPDLEELVLDNNNLDDTIKLPYLPHLHILSMNNNKITVLENLVTQIKYSMPSLRFLSLIGNKACPTQLIDFEKDENDYKRYRYFVLHYLPELRFLDSRPVTNEELDTAITKGEFTKIIRPQFGNEPLRFDWKLSLGSQSRADTSNIFTPLAVSPTQEIHHQAAYGRRRYRYAGKHSEGNRFILNRDL
ncbi:leucine-rich melanocyte differentiation-associated protein isoform X2 [Acyrthosiphon pisum]|uniref:Leucine-rich melanocyte differentiation-associated protein-like n=1 Tax=Acyrthosiphon pisum TaxID=7029 RepID=A0A8R2B6Q1_ACYPI|nr:leucine-rich melanocyte differentiation-associated protein isoform X2 [Acyrthosiphon pisum]|eukprot:XP_008183978.1 PREDICTED: leucine-rich repeat-containing protein C10orf11 homolog isoform X2 [Acyrthosiphon pisum]